MAENNDKYLKFEAESILSFLKQKLNENGKFTDQLYDGSNMSIILETLSLLYECFTYQQNFQASEATFNGVQIYENMLKIVSPLGYKARATIAPTILGNLTGYIYIDKVISNIDLNKTEETTLTQIASALNEALKIISNPKIVSKDLAISNPEGNTTYTVLENHQITPQFTNLAQNNIFYWTTNYSNPIDGLVNYIKYIWGVTDASISGNSNLAEVAEKLSTTVNELQNKSLVPTGMEKVPVNFRVSNSNIDNFITMVNGQWNTTFITNNTLGEEFEKYNIPSLNVAQQNLSDGTFYAAIYKSNTINTQGIEIYKAVSSLRNYTANDAVFEYYVDVDKTISIKFGNGIYGKKLEPGYSISLFYIINAGKSGEIAKSAFTNGQATFFKNSVNINSADTTIDINTLINRFIFDNSDVNAESQSDCKLVSLLVSSADGTYIPKVEIFFNPNSSSSKFQEIETVDYIRTMAPLYNRTNDRIITRNDLYTILKKEYIQYIYDVCIMNNFDYMAKFYSWLYKYNKISKDIASEGYKFSDSCNFNDIYCWLKGYSNYPINDFTKKNIERDLLQKKVLTSEIVFLDAITTFFYPYVGNIYDDIDWLLEAASKYQFLIKANNSSDTYYKKYQRIIGLFDKDEQGNIIKEPTKRMLIYLFSTENQELKIEVQAFRDMNANENLSTIKSNIVNEINSYFSINNRALGETIKLNELNDKIINIPGIKKIITSKQKNISLYTQTIPKVGSPTILENNINNTSFNTTFNTFYDYSQAISEAVMRFQIDKTILDNMSDVQIDWYFWDGTESGEKQLFKTGTYNSFSAAENSNDILKADLKFISSNEQELMKSGIIPYGTSDADKLAYYKKNWYIYAKLTRTDPATNTQLTAYTNKVRLAFTLSEDDTVSYYKFNSIIDDSNELSLLTETLANNSESNILNTAVWSQIDSTSTLSLAKWTNDLIDAADFEYIGSGYNALEDFCFPTLYQDITSLVQVKEDELDTIGIEY